MSPTASGFRRLFEPLTIGGFTLRNRIVNTTHHTALSEERELAYLRRRAQGGAAFFGISGGPGALGFELGPGAPGAPGQWDRKPPSPLTPEGIGLYDDLTIPRLAKRVDVIHAEGARCFSQVGHMGAGQHWPTIAPVFGPSNVADPYDALVPHAMSEEEIEAIIFAMSHAVRRICEAGCDAVELHGAHGYLLMQFMSPHFNRRADRWGGSRENRVRFVLEILSASRKLVGKDYPIGLRLGYEGDGHGRGITTEEAAEIARLLGPHLAYVSVSGGTYSGFADGFDGAYVSPWYREPAFNAETAAAVRRACSAPVLVTGRIADASIAESLLAEGVCDMVGMVRALIADPDLPNKAREGRADEVRMCLGMSECHHIGRHRVPMTCAVNAAAGREEEMAVTPAATRKAVVIVGAGPAGLEAARVAGLRGHKVYLCDDKPEIGGTVRLLSRDPNRRNLLDHAVYFETELAKVDVEFVLGHRVEADDVAEFGADAVIIATGGTPVLPETPGLAGAANVCTALEVLHGRARLGRRVLVVGGIDNHLGAPTIAEHLHDRGHEVEMISEPMDFAYGAEDGTRLPLFTRLRSKGVTLSLGVRLDEVSGDGAVVLDLFAKTRRRSDDVTVVLACGLDPQDALYRSLQGRVANLHLIGDALAPRRVMHATIEGARAGLAI